VHKNQSKVVIKLKERFLKSSIGRAIQLLDKKDRSKLVMLSFVQIITGVLDLIGITAIGALGALSVQGIESKNPGNKVGKFLAIIGLQHSNFRTQIAVIGIVAAIVLTSKTLVSVIYTRKTLSFLSIKGADLSAVLLAKYLSGTILNTRKKSTQEMLYITSQGFRNIMVGTLATFVNMSADAAMLIILSIGLFLIDPIIAVVTLSLFILLSILLYRLLQVRARQIGTKEFKYSVSSNEVVLEILNTFREAVVKDRRGYYIQKVNKIRHTLGELNAEMSFQPFISKYIIEGATVIGSLALAGYEFGTKNAVHAVATLAVFTTASMRIAPGALRIQQGFLVIKNASGSAEATFQLIDELQMVKPINVNFKNLDSNYHGFTPDVLLHSIYFKYPDNDNFEISNMNLTIPAGSRVALVGPTGSGKTTLVDILLGVLEPDSGSIQISGLKPLEAFKKWPGACAYAPQEIYISAGTIRENIALGYEYNESFEKSIWEAAETAQLSDTLSNLKDGLDSETGELGSNLSGGQRQRLGIARALFTKPKLLILDEATSSLDGKTEHQVSHAISNLSADITVIIIAHRLSTIKNVDQVIYIDKGQIIAKGTFDEVRGKVPNFDEQAGFMGL